MPQNLETMSGPKLEALARKLNDAHYVVVQEYIDAGLGHMRGSDIAVAAKQGDERAIRYEKTYADYLRAWEELQARRRYHGGTKPIRRK